MVRYVGGGLTNPFCPTPYGSGAKPLSGSCLSAQVHMPVSVAGNIDVPQFSQT
jgi:hypothetical protein